MAPQLGSSAGRARALRRQSVPMKVIKLRDGKDRSLLRRHPWVFQGSIEKGRADPGETVRVESHEGAFLAWGAYSPVSQIRVRAWSFDEAERIDAKFFERRLAAAIALRARMAVPSDGVRLVHGEADGLPGLVVDRYGDILSAQFLAAGAERWKAAIADALLALTGCPRLYERSDASVRGLEGLPSVRAWLRGGSDDPAASRVTIHESGWQLTVDVAEGHKTGYYLDQRDNRARFAQLVRHYGCRSVLNCFSYTGGFSVAALARAHEHVALNGFDPALHETRDADVNAFLRERLNAGEGFDAIVLDPPKFAPTAAHADRASRAYKDINRLALKLLKPGGLLLTFSCSGGISADLFHKIVAGAAMDAEVDGALLEKLEGAPDHPTTLMFPEGEYLKGLAILKA